MVIKKVIVYFFIIIKINDQLTSAASSFLPIIPSTRPMFKCATKIKYIIYVIYSNPNWSIFT